MYISSSEKARLNEIFAKNDDIVTFIDGACTGNPGLAGAGVAFFARSMTGKINDLGSISESENEQI